MTRSEVVFVAMDVGGAGGMERHAEQLITRVLDAGHPVTVVARTCKLPAHPRLRFRPVAVPRRPASLVYPAFFALASLRVLRRRGAVLHTTGAVVANRADLSTVHYCHRAARTEVTGSRASRSSRLYRLNAAVMRVLSLAGEAWCYRPARARLLCAVSSGVADELTREFPSMAGFIRTIPNGVDSALFRPDAVARANVRRELGIGDDVRLALFAGGDWERKGLVHALDALALAPGWHLAVAGPGDAAAHTSRAHAAGYEARVHFLGRVSDMPRMYAAADAFVFPTAYEAFPLVALEAAASGLPLLITRVNGATELLDDGRAGWFITRDAADIARRLNELAADPQRSADMATQARASAARFSWDAMADQYVSLYAELSSTGRVSHKHPTSPSAELGSSQR